MTPAIANASDMPATTNGSNKKDEMPSTAAPPINGTAQQIAHAPIIPIPASQSLFFMYITFQIKL
jgi:hypothetical protein